MMMANLRALAAEEGVKFREHDFTANSHKALLLAEASKKAGHDIFYALHRRLFTAFFEEGLDIGDEAVLTGLAIACGVPGELIQQAWTDPEYEHTLQQNLAASGKYNVRATPTVFFSEQHRLNGAVPYERFLETARAGFIEQQQP